MVLYTSALKTSKLYLMHLSHRLPKLIRALSMFFTMITTVSACSVVSKTFSHLLLQSLPQKVILFLTVKPLPHTLLDTLSKINNKSEHILNDESVRIMRYWLPRFP